MEITLHASQLATQVIHTRQVVFAAVQVFQNQVSRRQGKLGLVDPALDIVAIVVGLVSPFRYLIASRLAHAAQDFVFELALGIRRALHHLLHPCGALQLLGLRRTSTVWRLMPRGMVILWQTAT